MDGFTYGVTDLYVIVIVSKLGTNTLVDGSGFITLHILAAHVHMEVAWANASVLVPFLRKTWIAVLTLAPEVSGQAAKLHSVHVIRSLRFGFDRGCKMTDVHNTYEIWGENNINITVSISMVVKELVVR